MERTMDRIADELGSTVRTVRSVNLITAEEFPYDQGSSSRTAAVIL